MEKAKKYYGVSNFETIISFGDGLWDVTTAKNLGIHFVGVNDKNKSDFEKMNVKHHISNWTEFHLKETKTKLQIL
jgi:FMN phosphatase YigB (HAD superfamily)